MSTAVAMGNSTLVRIDKQSMIDTLHSEPTFSGNIRIQENVVDRLFNPAGAAAHGPFGKEGKSD